MFIVRRRFIRLACRQNVILFRVCSDDSYLSTVYSDFLYKKFLHYLGYWFQVSSWLYRRFPRSIDMSRYIFSIQFSRTEFSRPVQNQRGITSRTRQSHVSRAIQLSGYAIGTNIQYIHITRATQLCRYSRCDISTSNFQVTRSPEASH